MLDLYQMCIPNLNFLPQFVVVVGGGGSSARNNVKNGKTNQTTTIFGDARECNEADESRYPKGTSKTSTKCTYHNFLAEFGGELCEEQTQKIIKTKQKTTLL